MARITRKTLNIFSNGASNNGQFGSAQAGSPLTSTDPTVIQSLAAWASGWVSAVIGGQKLPPLEEFQGVSFVHSYMTAYMFQEGVPEWDTGTTYYQHSIVKKTGTYQIYGSKTDTNVGNALTDTTNWLLLQDLSAPSSAQVAYGLTTNSGNAYSVTTTPAVTAPTAGQLFEIKFNAANTGAATLNVGGSGAVGILDRDGNALTSGQIIANRDYLLIHNGTNFLISEGLNASSSYGTTTNATNAYSVTTSPSFNALTTGQTIFLKFNAVNTGAITLNPNSIGATTVQDIDGNAIAAGHIVTNRRYEVFFDGTNFILLGTYPGIKQNSQSAAYTTVMADNGGQIYHPSADTTARVWTIDSNANVPYPIGAAITFVNDTSAGVITIAITSDTLVLAGTGSTGSRTLSASGMATAVKKTATSWMISGSGLT